MEVWECVRVTSVDKNLRSNRFAVDDDMLRGTSLVRPALRTHRINFAS